MQARCGAWQVGSDAQSGAVEFRVFFPAGVDPHVSSIVAVGDLHQHWGGRDWDPASGVPLTVESPPERPGTLAGTFWSGRTPVDVPAGFSEYKLLVTFDDGTSRLVTDPCTRYSGLHGDNSGVVVGGSSPADNAVRPLPGGRLPLEELVVYEMMLDDFTDGFRGARAPLTAVVDKLDDLAAMGVNALLVMPWTAWSRRDFDWGYEPRLYFAVESRYANELDRPAEKLALLKHLVSACHDRGIHVLMDGVYNHVSVDFPYPQLYRDPLACPFTAEPFGGSFATLQDLDFSNECTQELIDDVCRYWTDVFGIDGIRFDNTVNFYVHGTMSGLPDVLEHIDAHVRSTGEHNFSLTLEHIDPSAATVTALTAATSFWDDALHDVTFQGLWRGGIDSRLLNALNNRRLLPAGKVPTLYLSNHDHSHVTWQSGARTNQGAIGTWWRVQPYLIALFTSTGVPLLHNGQEFGEEHWLPENDEGTGRRVTPRPLRWRLREDPIGRSLVALHTRLAIARREHPALRSAEMYPAAWDEWQTMFNPVGVGVDTRRGLAVYHRWAQTVVRGEAGVENVVVVLNFSDDAHELDVPFPYGGRWVDLLSSTGWSVEVPADRAVIPVSSHFGRILRAFRPD